MESPEPIKIEGLNPEIKPAIENLGTFKLKDKEGRQSIKVDMSQANRSLTDLMCFYVVKIFGENNKVKILVQWKPETKNENPGK